MRFIANTYWSPLHGCRPSLLIDFATLECTLVTEAAPDSIRAMTVAQIVQSGIWTI